jgi:protein-tyrosine phosphatase
MHALWVLAVGLCIAMGGAAPDASYCAKLRETGRDADEVEPGLWLGNVCAAVDADFLRAHNITAVMNMAREWDTLCTGGDVQWLWLGWLLGQPWRHCFPLDDTSAQSAGMVQHRFAVAAHWIRHYHRERGGAVLVHCNMGISRSAAAVIHYLMARDAHLTYQEALQRVKRARPIAQPNGLFEQLLLGSVEEQKMRRKPKQHVRPDN